MTLYEALGLTKTADKADIKRAYRTKAKEAHPDAPGGSAEAFAAVNDAYRVLSDDEARTRYDETGEARVDSKVQDMKRAKAINVIGTAFERIVSQHDILTTNLPVEIIRLVQGNKADITRAIAQLTAETEKFQKALTKLKRSDPDGEDYLTHMITGRIGQMAVPLAEAKDDLEAVNLALDMLDQGYQYSHDQPPTRYNAFTNFTQTTTRNF